GAIRSTAASRRAERTAGRLDEFKFFRHARYSAAVERQRVGRAQLRLRADRQALLLRRRRTQLLRLLRPHDDGLGAGGRVHAAWIVRPDGDVPERVDEPTPAR